MIARYQITHTAYDPAADLAVLRLQNGRHAKVYLEYCQTPGGPFPGDVLLVNEDGKKLVVRAGNETGIWRF